MTDKPENPPAFPTTKPLDSWGDPNQGMTLRDYFAAKAMQGVAAACANDTRGQSMEEFAYSTSVAAYIIADAMLKARSK